MKQIPGLLFLVMMITCHAKGQEVIDSLKERLAISLPDTNRVLILSELSVNYSRVDQDSAMKYALAGLALARELNFKRGEADCIRRSGIVLFNLGRYPEALVNLQKALLISESIHDNFGIGAANGHIGRLYSEQGNFAKARTFFFLQLALNQSMSFFERENAFRNIGRTYFNENKLDSAQFYYDSAFRIHQTNLKNVTQSMIYAVSSSYDYGQLYEKKGDAQRAMDYFRKCVSIGLPRNDFIILNQAYVAIAALKKKSGQIDSAVFFAKSALTMAQKSNYAKGIIQASLLLSELYEPINEHEALMYSKSATAIKDSLFNTEKSIQVQNLFFLEQQRQQALQAQAVKFKNRLELFASLLGVLALLIIAIMLYRNNRTKQKANNLLHSQKLEIERQRTKAENALEELKSTQTQLIHSEKMASLGELTAGIAHEIQNPLNFVNNFSDVNKELIDELQSELNNGNKDEAVSISNMIRENELKIIHHGKRADSIVKGMLQHSRNSTGQKELANVNTTADEYLRLSYHGLKAKDKSFNVTVRTDFDVTMPKINIVPQDFGRALLNLYNNAFHAAIEKKNQIGGSSDYEPVVSITTKNLPDHIELQVMDNGVGIPQKIIDKIFQPFFTTKPSGSGTGLGLSLTYDIVKAHGGELRVETQEDEFSTFIIVLPKT